MSMVQLFKDVNVSRAKPLTLSAIESFKIGAQLMSPYILDCVLTSVIKQTTFSSTYSQNAYKSALDVAFVMSQTFPAMSDVWPLEVPMGNLLFKLYNISLMDSKTMFKDIMKHIFYASSYIVQKITMIGVLKNIQYTIFPDIFDSNAYATIGTEAWVNVAMAMRYNFAGATPDNIIPITGILEAYAISREEFLINKFAIELVDSVYQNLTNMLAPFINIGTIKTRIYFELLQKHYEDFWCAELTKIDTFEYRQYLCGYISLETDKYINLKKFNQIDLNSYGKKLISRGGKAKEEVRDFNLPYKYDTMALNWNGGVTPMSYPQPMQPMQPQMMYPQNQWQQQPYQQGVVMAPQNCMPNMMQPAHVQPFIQNPYTPQAYQTGYTPGYVPSYQTNYQQPYPQTYGNMAMRQ